MAIFNFTGANGDPLPSGLTARNGTFEIQDNHAVATSPEPANPRWVFTLEGTADGNLSAPIFVGADSGSAAGFVLRYNPADGSHIFVNMSLGNDEVRVYTFSSGAYSQIGAGSFNFTQNNSYLPSADMDGDSIVVSIGGSAAVTVTTNFNQTQTHHGIRLNKLDQYVDSIEFTESSTVEPPAETDSISIDEAPKNNHPYQRDSGGTATVDFNVTYTGSPTSLQYRLLDASDDSTVLQDWATFDTSPSGVSSTLSITRSPSLTPIHVEVRFSNEPSVNDLQTNDWYVADIILIGGQSLSEDMNTDGVVTPLDGYFVYSNGGFVTPTTGVGANAIASAIITAENCPVFIINTGVGGTALTQESGQTDYWNRSSGGSLWPDTVNAVNTATSGANEIAFMWWHQGTKDSLEGVTETQYLSALNEFFTRVRGTFSGKGGSTLEIIMATFGRDTRGGATNTSHQAIRDAQINYIVSDDNTYPVNVYTSQNEDGVHATDAAYIELGQQVATQYYVMRGLVSGSIPSIISANTGDSSTEIDVSFSANLLLTDTTYSTEGIYVEDSSGALTVSSFERKNANTATITVNEIPTGTAKVWFSWGKGSSASSLTYPRSQPISLPNGAGDFSLVASAFSNYEVSALVANTPPTANAGPDQSVAAATQFTLDGAGSQDTDGTIVEWRWTQTAGDTVILNLEDPARPTATSPSKTTAQRLTFQLVTVDDEGAESSPGTVNIDVAAFAVSEMLKLLDTRQWTVVNDGSVQAFEGRSNREAFRFLVTPSDGIQTSAEGYFLFDQPGVHAVEVISTPTSKISSIDDPHMIRGDVIAARIGDLQTDENGNLTLTFVLYVTDDKDGLVMTAKVIEPYQKASYFRKQG
ncbi:sialate O-acetylesterase [Alteromonas sp. KUL106]|uniref:sialate O-acetylesterase n=1 Tax=Alteromonas sp. KUL106 TaxID=2480799 RepID=UPI0012E4AF25|nr:sialate O-acetylesterase [Alteromonas sp. KUL106]GFD68095.1 hypothetical protein KUL106_13580 [Alteromonas sp. KUL106]